MGKDPVLKKILERWKFKHLSSDFRCAFLYYLVSYPVVFLVSFFSLNVLKLLGYEIEIQQVAVQSFLNLKESYPLLLRQIFVVVIATPLIEEFLFRTILFSFLRRYLHFWGALLLSSLFFGAAHYAPEQGARNVDIMVGLFTFSCFLGSLYEKQHSLAAPFFLHALFNLTGVAFLIFM